MISGVPLNWRTGIGRSLPNYMPVYRAFYKLSPWTVGAYNSISSAESYKTNVESKDVEFCRSNGIDIQPVIFLGSAWTNWNPHGPRNEIKREHGDFMWQQFLNIRQLAIQNGYTVTFDEYDEGTAIAKAAEDTKMIPTNQYFLTLDADGVHCSSDFYLRVTRDGAKMMKRQTALVNKVPTGFLKDN